MPSTVPPKKNLCDLKEAFPDIFRELDEECDEYNIWASAWHKPDGMFRMVDGFPVLHISVPDTELRQILVRQEYVHAYEDILQFYNDAVLRSSGREVGRRKFTTPDILPTFGLAEVMRGLHTPDPHSASDNIRAAMVITGHPGIGKSISLWYYLVRRLIVHETVVFQTEPDSLLIFHDRGVTMVNSLSSDKLLLKKIRNVLPLSTWWLVDSDADFSHPGANVTRVGHFIVQAASPNAARNNWYRKARCLGARYIMKPMSLLELQFARRCDAQPAINVEEIRKFYVMYGPSAWGALMAGVDDWKVELKTALKSVGDSPATLNTILNQLSVIADTHPTISSKLFLLSPGPRRDKANIQIITPHVENELVKWARKKWGSNSRAFFNAVAGGPSLSQNIAGSFLESYVHPMLVAGQRATGQKLLLTPLLRNGTSKTWSIYHDPKHPLRLVLPASETTFRIQPSKDSLTTVDSNLRQEDYGAEPPVLKDHVYYKPRSKTQATIDSFVYSRSSNTILAFQVTVTPKHKVLPSGLTWLKSLRAAGCDDPPTIFLAGVNVGDDLGFACKDGAERLVANFYHLRLDKLPRDPQLGVETEEDAIDGSGDEGTQMEGVVMSPRTS